MLGVTRRARLAAKVKLNFQFRRYRLPFRMPVRTAHGAWTEREGLYVRLERADGTVSFGEAAPIPWFGTETVDEAAEVCRSFGEMVSEETLRTLPTERRCLRFACTTALRGFAGEGSEPPSADYLGVAALIPAGRIAPAEITTKADGGFRVFKWKVGVGDLADELSLLDDVCAALPSGGKLRLDANGAWDRRQAQRWLERCADRPVEFVEQPCFAPASEGETVRRKTDDTLRGLAEEFPTKIALDESLADDADIARWLEAGWSGIFVVKPSLLGDADAAAARLAHAKTDVVFSSALETALGAQAALRLAFAWQGPKRALGFGVWPLFTDWRFDGPAAAPFIRREDLTHIQPGALWNAAS